MLQVIPMTREMPAIAVSRTVSSWLVELRAFNNSCMVRMGKSSSSLARSRCDGRMIVVIFLVAVSKSVRW